MYRPSWSCPWSLFICSIVAVVVIVGGQPTTDDDSDKSIIDQLIYTVTKVVDENNMLKTKVAKLEAQVSAKSKSVCLVFSAISCKEGFLVLITAGLI